MANNITWVGMDDSAKTINLAIFRGQENNPREESIVTNDSTGLGRMVKKLKAISGEVRCVYEAGVNGYHLQRFLAKHGISCDVAAPSLTPRRAGKRVKTDKLDAKALARLYRAGELTCIFIPQNEQESLRDLVRAREDALEDQQRARHRLARFLMRRGLKYASGKNWTQGHLRWVKSLRFEDDRDQMVLDEYQLILAEQTDRLQRLNAKIEEVAKQPTYEKRVRYLMALKGIRVLTAMTIIAEALDLRRFTDAPAFMAAIGVVPSEDSSGEVERRGRITKTGNNHIRRVMIESAWTYQHSSVSGKTVQNRRNGLPAEVIEIARQCDKRLHQKFRRMASRGKDRKKIAVAVSRELAGFVWAMGKVA
ncbi:MAG TPA: IS110 family transposase [Acidobacteriota bacterium]|nr:IS110 family transposase [Acidobacteriota bacterium]